jgi:putative ABC transport system permease protein
LILGIVALGVGSFNGIRQASRAATANFGLFNEAISGRSDFIITAPVGPLKVKDLDGLSALARSPDWHLLPVIEGPLTQISPSGEAERLLRLVGIDLLSVANLPAFIDQGFEFGAEDVNWYEWIGRSKRIWISHQLSEENGLVAGDLLTATVSGRQHRLEVTGVLGGPDRPIPADLVIADLPSVQTILARSGEIDRVEVVVQDRSQRKDPKALSDLEARLASLTPEGLTLRPAAARVAERAEMTTAFRMNLTILSLIAILVGAYLILQALDTAVVRRRAELATLKSLGVGESTLFLTLMFESLLIGIAGSVLGLGVGMLLATGAVHALADTVNALYFATSVESIRLQPADVGWGLGVGIVFSLLAGWLPARDAMSTPAAQVLARGDWSPGFNWLRRPWIGLCLLALGLLCLQLEPVPIKGGAKLPLGGFCAAGLWIIGGALLSGQLLVGLARLGIKAGGGVFFRLALSRLAEGSSRHRLAVSGLAVAVAMVAGMLQMVGSFRGTIENWFEVRFQADLYVSERGAQGASTMNGINPAILSELYAGEAIAFTDTLYTTIVAGPKGRTLLVGADFDAWTHRIRQIWIKKPGLLPAVAEAKPALISESFARRFGLMDGGVAELVTPTGPRSISPVGIYADYGNEFGAAVVDIPVWQQWTGMERPINTSIYLKEGSAVNELRDALRLQFPGLDIRNGEELRRAALGIFEQTFRVTSALSLIGLSVALIGLVLGLFSIFSESADTWSTLRRLGFPARGYWITAGLEGAGIAAAAWVGGTLVGLGLGWVLIYVINVQSFGWTLIWHQPYAGLAWLGLSLIVLGYLAGALTGFWWERKQ